MATGVNIAAGVLGALAFSSPLIAGPFYATFAGTQTSVLHITGPGGEDVAFTVSTPVNSVVELLPQATSRRGYLYYQAKSDLNAAGLHNNPLYNGSGPSGNNPLAGARYIYVRPINDPPVVGDGPDLYVASDDFGQPDLWENAGWKVQFVNDAGAVLFSYVAEGGLDLASSSAQVALSPGVTSTFAYSSGTGPLKWMAPEAIRRGNVPSLWLESATLSLTVVSVPGAMPIGLAGLAGVLAARRRR